MDVPGEQRVGQAVLEDRHDQQPDDVFRVKRQLLREEERQADQKTENIAENSRIFRIAVLIVHDDDLAGKGEGARKRQRVAEQTRKVQAVQKADRAARKDGKCQKQFRQPRLPVTEQNRKDEDQDRGGILQHDGSPGRGQLDRHDVEDAGGAHHEGAEHVFLRKFQAQAPLDPEKHD